MSRQLLVIGFSARAAAFSALRAGFDVVAIDHFADRDLSAACPAVRVERYPAGLASAAARWEPGDWLFTGGLENYPRLVAIINRQHRLLGNAPEVLRRVRDPFALHAALAEAGLPAAPVRATADGLPLDGSWLCKPRRGSGGSRIEPLSPATDLSGVGRQWYFQRRVDGIAASAVFVAAASRAALLGVTRQAIGAAGAPPFGYAGSVGPIRCTAEQTAAWRRIGTCLAERFSLVGLFGVDAVVQGDTVTPIEINPRYTASIEVLERAMGWQAVALHAAACRDGRLLERTEGTPGVLAGKAVLYATSDVRIAASFGKAVDGWNEKDDWSAAADIPHDGAIIRRGQPIATVFAADEDEVQLQQRLDTHAASLRSALEPV